MPDFALLQEFLNRYFPGRLSAAQMEQFRIAFEGLANWNEKVNLISRKDLENLAERHFLHSLAIAKALSFPPGFQVMDVGTGGGFPGIPLAIFFPETQFFLVDSISKKIKVVEDIAHKCGLKNVQCAATRAEMVNRKFDFVISRAVTDLPTFLPWVKNKFLCRQGAELPGGVLYLKGESWKSEIPPGSDWAKDLQSWPLSEWFSEPFFSTKFLLHIPLCK